MKKICLPECTCPNCTPKIKNKMKKDCPCKVCMCKPKKDKSKLK